VKLFHRLAAANASRVVLLQDFLLLRFQQIQISVNCGEPMISLEAVRVLYNYNYWARNLQLKACAMLTEEQFVRPMGGSFSSIRDTLAHLVDNEAYYLHRWQGHSREQIVEALGASKSTDRAKNWPKQFATLSDIENHWKQVEQDIRRFLNTLNESDLLHDVTYGDSGGKSWTYPLWALLLHVTNHQTYHRGQVTVLLRQLGVAPPAIDFLAGFHDGFAAS
jgi:uncharacterized damage-inducible protein DinB